MPPVIPEGDAVLHADSGMQHYSGSCLYFLARLGNPRSSHGNHPFIRFAGMIWVLSHFMQEKVISASKKGIFKLRKRIVENIFSIGMSPFLMNVCASAIVIIFNKSLLLYGGDLAIGAYGILNRLLMLFVMVIMGLTMGNANRLWAIIMAHTNSAG